MVEFIDNLIQVIVTFVCFVWSCTYFHKTGKQAYFILLGFFGCFTFAGLYWTLYYSLFLDTPHVFYVSEVGWSSGSILLRLLQYALSDEEERSFRTRYSWISLVIGVPLLIYYYSYRDILFSSITTVIMIILSWHAIRGIVYWRRKGIFDYRMRFQIVVLVFVLLEYCLWIAGDFWIGDTVKNPYFWFDFLLTIWRFFLLYVTKKVVSQ